MGQSRTPDAARRSERSRKAILTAAAELVSETGYAKLTIEAIAARAGVGKQTIYRWWPSKGAVLLDVLHEVRQSYNEPGEVSMEYSDDFGADLRYVLRTLVKEFNDPRLDPAYRAVHAEIQHDTELMELFHQRLVQPGLEGTKQRLRTAQQAGQVAADVDLAAAVDLLWGPIFHRWLLREGPLTVEYADTLAAFAIKALRP